MDAYLILTLKTAPSANERQAFEKTMDELLRNVSPQDLVKDPTSALGLLQYSRGEYFISTVRWERDANKARDALHSPAAFVYKISLNSVPLRTLEEELSPAVFNAVDLLKDVVGRYSDEKKCFEVSYDKGVLEIPDSNIPMHFSPFVIRNIILEEYANRLDVSSKQIAQVLKLPKYEALNLKIDHLCIVYDRLLNGERNKASIEHILSVREEGKAVTAKDVVSVMSVLTSRLSEAKTGVKPKEQKPGKLAKPVPARQQLVQGPSKPIPIPKKES